LIEPSHVVLRVLPGPQGDIYAGTLVDASAWPNQRLLEGAGYIRRLTPAEMAALDAASRDPKQVKKPR
jgi:hypothetical protein